MSLSLLNFILNYQKISASECFVAVIFSFEHVNN